MLKKLAFLSLIVCAALYFTGCTGEEGDDTAENEMASTSNGTTDMESTSNGTGGMTETSNGETPETVYRFVLVEDLTDPVSGDYPGVDIDGIGVTKASDGVEYFATSVEDFNIDATGNLAADPNQLVGELDSDCVATSGKFTALGGAASDGYVIVGFSTTDNEVTFTSGDTVSVYELGETFCDGMFQDDPYTVSVSAGTERGDFVLVGTQAAGELTFTIP